MEFGPDVTNQFCITNSIALVLRSHECVQEGYEVLHDGRLITIFSASRYCGTQTNKGNHFCSLSCVVVVVVFLFVVGRWLFRSFLPSPQHHANHCSSPPFPLPGAFITFGPDLQPEIQQFYAHAMESTSFESKAEAEEERLDTLEEDALRMIIERVCDKKADLYWYDDDENHPSNLCHNDDDQDVPD